MHEELRAALGDDALRTPRIRRGYRNGTKMRKLTGPTGPVALTLPRRCSQIWKEWTSRIVPRDHRRMPEVNEAIVATHLAEATPGAFAVRFSRCSRPRRARRRARARQRARAASDARVARHPARIRAGATLTLAMQDL